MSEMDFERSWLGMALGGEWEPVPWKEKEGRVPVTELSARDLSCSDQLKPYWSFPGLLPLRKFRMAALPPKLMCRAKGVVGAVLGPPNSSSSMAFSLMESEFELVDMLPRRMKEEEVSVGDVPESPIVVIDKRRLCASALPLPLGNGGPAGAFEGPRENRLDKAAWVIELRRWTPVPGPLGEVSDMALVGGAESKVKL